MQQLQSRRDDERQSLSLLLVLQTQPRHRRLCFRRIGSHQAIQGIWPSISFRFSNAGSPSTVVCGGVGPAFENLSCTKPRAVEAGSSRARYGDLGEAGGRCRRARPAFDAVGNDSGGSSLWKFRSWPASQSNFSWPSCFERASGGSKAEFGRRRRARDSAKEWRCKANHEAASIMTCRS